MSDLRRADSRPLRRCSGVGLLFHQPLPPPQDIPAERLLAEREAAGFAAGSAAERAALAAQQKSELAAQKAHYLAELAAQESRCRAELATQEARHGAALAALDSALAEALTPLALAVAQALLATEPPAATIAALVAQVIEALPEAAAGTLRGPPAARPLLPAGWQWRDDPALAPGTVIAELDATRVTASLAARLEQLAHELAP